ncbi:MAG: hypothetical protein WBD97_23015, partial [Pseudolabrys sp.]
MSTNVVGRGITGVDPQIVAVAPAQLLKGLCERRKAGLSFRIVLGPIHEHADAPHPLGLLCARRERPRSRCAPEERDEVAAVHSMTSSASNCNDTGTSRPSALAVCIL